MDFLKSFLHNIPTAMAVVVSIGVGLVFAHYLRRWWAKIGVVFNVIPTLVMPLVLFFPPVVFGWINWNDHLWGVMEYEHVVVVTSAMFLYVEVAKALRFENTAIDMRLSSLFAMILFGVWLVGLTVRFSFIDAGTFETIINSVIIRGPFLILTTFQIFDSLIANEIIRGLGEQRGLVRRK